MKKLFGIFWRRNLAFAKLAVVTNLEYRANFFTDVIVQPLVSTLIELTLWYAVFASLHGGAVGGFSRDYYLAYAVWASFLGRVTSNWMYEFKMTAEIESGSVNTILVRPLTFYEYYLSQFLGYKISSCLFSLIVPILVVIYWRLPSALWHLPAVLALVLCYLVLLHTMSFVVCALAFQFNRVNSITMAKNLTLWVMSGELFPLDLLPEPVRSIFISLPFSSAVYLPVGYLTGRIESPLFYRGFASVFLGTIFFGMMGATLWNRGLRDYAGTGA